MFIAQQLRKKNIAEYLLYMWQVEDTIRAFGCSLSRIRREYIARFDYSEEQKEEETDWFGNLIRMMNEEGCREKGHLQINKVVMQQLTDLHHSLLHSRVPVLRGDLLQGLALHRGNQEQGRRDRTKPELETCFNSLYGVMMLRLATERGQRGTAHAAEDIGKMLGNAQRILQTGQGRHT